MLLSILLEEYSLKSSWLDLLKLVPYKTDPLLLFLSSRSLVPPKDISVSVGLFLWSITCTGLKDTIPESPSCFEFNTSVWLFSLEASKAPIRLFANKNKTDIGLCTLTDVFTALHATHILKVIVGLFIRRLVVDLRKCR